MKTRRFGILSILATVAVGIAVMAFTNPVLAEDSLAQAVKSGNAKSYIVLMADSPVISYEGNITNLAATKPGKGKKINPNSAHVRKYQKFLEKSHDASLAKAGVDQSAVVNRYTIALNGYSAILSVEQAKAIDRQADVVKVMEDQMRFLDTDASPDFLGLTVY